MSTLKSDLLAIKAEFDKWDANIKFEVRYPFSYVENLKDCSLLKPNVYFSIDDSGIEPGIKTKFIALNYGDFIYHSSLKESILFCLNSNYFKNNNYYKCDLYASDMYQILEITEEIDKETATSLWNKYAMIK